MWWILKRKKHRNGLCSILRNLRKTIHMPSRAKYLLHILFGAFQETCRNWTQADFILFAHNQLLLMIACTLVPFWRRARFVFRRRAINPLSTASYADFLIMVRWSRKKPSGTEKWCVMSRRGGGVARGGTSNISKLHRHPLNDTNNLRVLISYRGVYHRWPATKFHTELNVLD